MKALAIGAQPGWNVVRRLTTADGKFDGIYKMAIIGWALETDVITRFGDESVSVYVMPITCEGTETLDDEEGIEQPDGMVVMPQDRCFRNCDDYVRFLKGEVGTEL